jgi:hypothetical protein
MALAADLLADAEQHCAALERLNAIAALGLPVGPDYGGEISRVKGRVVRCNLAGPLSLEVTPRCPDCQFVIGTLSPGSELQDLLGRIRAALKAKLAAVAQNAITRLIREHDHSRRLEGFLKITQAAQTDALIRLLDDKLARYLARLCDEVLADDPAQAQSVMPIRRSGTLPPMPKRTGGKSQRGGDS